MKTEQKSFKVWFKKNWTMVLLVVVFTAGLCLLMYPSVSNYVNSFHASRVISAYDEALSHMTPEDYTEELEKAKEFNVKTRHSGMGLSDEDKKLYNEALNIGGAGVMGHIEIEKLNVSLPIYHGTSDQVLEIGVGHLEGSSLPVGGESTHCVLSGHRGLPSAKLFTHLDRLAEGDVFKLFVLNEEYTYQVDQILIVEPDNITALGIEEGKDYCTLVTCTPYGINTHRLLVRGHRVGNAVDINSVPADGVQMEPTMMAPIVGAPILLGILIWVISNTRKRKKERKVYNEAMGHVLGGRKLKDDDKDQKEG